MRIFLMFCLLFQVGLSDEVQEYEVVGSVVKPGKVKWEKGVTLAKAIKAAGGVKKGAIVDQVTLTRNQKHYLYDFQDSAHLKIEIYSGDVIQVKPGGFVRRIRPGQNLQIAVTGVTKDDQARLNAIYSVDEKGIVTLWKIGAIKAQGKTKAEFAKALAEAYKEAGIFEAAIFQVRSEGLHGIQDGQIFTVGGQVRGPGQKRWINGLTLYAAIQAAGGETPFAAMGRVKLYRNGKAYVYDMKRQDHKNVKVYARDVIEVPQMNITPR